MVDDEPRPSGLDVDTLPETLGGRATLDCERTVVTGTRTRERARNGADER
jgi:hypothetical protein